MRRPAALLAALLLSPLAGPALGDGDASWEAFRAKVETACRALVEAPEGADVAVEVNPFGSESYGVALVRVTASYGPDLMACVMSKATGEAELTAAFLPPAPEAEAAPAPAP